VRAIVTDRKVPVDVDQDQEIDHYFPDLTSGQDYYPSGMLLMGRNWNFNSYRYGFNTQESIDEISGVNKSATNLPGAGKNRPSPQRKTP